MRDSLRRAWRRFLWRTLAAYWIFLFCATHIPKLELPGPRDSDKFAHFLAFSGLASLAWFARRFELPPPRLRAAMWIWLLIAAYAAFDEITQPAFGRSGDLVDWIADMGGATTGLLVSIAMGRRVRT